MSSYSIRSVLAATFPWDTADPAAMTSWGKMKMKAARARLQPQVDLDATKRESWLDETSWIEILLMGEYVRTFFLLRYGNFSR